MGVSQAEVAGHRVSEAVAPLLEREHELETLARGLDRLANGVGSMLLVEGPAGIGKTRLLAEAAAHAQRKDVLVRAARAGQLERDMPFAVASQLLEPVLERASEEERSRLLAGSARLALIAFGHAEGEQAAAEADRLAPVHGLYWLLANLADSKPVLLVIDDAHWADAQTLRFLDYLARRLSDLPVLVIVSARSGEPDERARLEPLRSEAELLHPRPLSPLAIRELLAAEFRTDPSVELTEACARATAGNPFLLVEVVRSLRADAIEPDANAAAGIGQLGPKTVARHVLMRLGRFGDEAHSLARAIAVLGRSPQLRHAATLLGLDEGQARELCDRLRDAEILAPGQPIEFVHPLVRQAIYRDLSEGDRSAAHRRAAEVLRATGAGSRGVAAHLMACSPNGDQWVVAQLCDAAREAMAAGAPDAAKAHLERALEEPPEDELPIVHALAKVLRETDPARAPDLLTDVAGRTSDPQLRMDALRYLPVAYVHAGDMEEAAHACAEALEAVPKGDRELALVLEAQLFCLSTASRGREPSRSARIRAVAAGAEARTTGERLVRQALAVERFLDCDPVDEVAELAASQIPPPWEFRGERVLVPAFANRILAFSGRWDQSRAAVVRFTEAAYESGSLVSVSSGLGFLAQVDRLSGRLSDAEAEARTAWEIATELVSLSPYGWAALMNLLASLIARGDLEAAARLTEGFDLSAGPGEIPIDPWPIEMRGYMRLAEGDLAGAAQDLLAFGEELERWGALNPAFAPWRQEAAPALAALGRTAEGEQLIFEAEKRARRFKAPHLIGTVLRSRALLEPRKRAIETLGESVALLERSGPPHELARSLLERGAALRRDGRRSEAREPLRRALELAHRTGAGALARRAGEELAAAGSRPRSVFRIGVAALTASELRTARLAAEGLNNREITERLFVTRRTVETHLTHVYAKLDIAGREQLQAALAADPS